MAGKHACAWGCTSQRAPQHGMGLLPGLLRLRLEAMILPAPVTSLALQADLEPGQVPAGTDLLGQTCSRMADCTRCWSACVRGWVGRRCRASRYVPSTGRRAPGERWQILWQASGSREPATDSAVPGPSGCCRRRSRWGWLPGSPHGRGAVCLSAARNASKAAGGMAGMCAGITTGPAIPQGAMLWVYRDLRSQDWYLQGVFG